MNKPRLGFLGGTGRMGVEARRAIATGPYSEKFAKVEWPTRSEGFENLFETDVWVEFSSPDAVLDLCRESERRRSRIPLVVGATGWTPAQLSELEQHATRFPILKASNFAVGVQICRDTLRFWAERSELADWKVSIRELHHTGKKDAPSGTALTLAESIRAGGSKSIPIESVREGEIFGIHEIVYESGSEKITLVHEAKSRLVFAEGALEAAIRLAALSNTEPSTAKLPKRLLSLDDLYLRRTA